MHKLQIQSTKYTAHSTGYTVHSAHLRSSTHYTVHATQLYYKGTQYTVQKNAEKVFLIYPVNVRTQYTVHTT